MNVKIEKGIQLKDTDWNKPQLLINTESDRVIISTGRQSDERSFSGIDVESCEYSEYWLKECFKPFNGTITLSND